MIKYAMEPKTNIAAYTKYITYKRHDNLKAVIKGDQDTVALYTVIKKKTLFLM